jgi:PAS domain S-box-containing protein
VPSVEAKKAAPPVPLAILSDREELVDRAVAIAAAGGLDPRPFPFRAAAAAEPGLALIDLDAGPRALAALAALRTVRRHHVLVLAGPGDDDAIRKAIAGGADDFLVAADLERYLGLRLAAGVAAYRARVELEVRERDLATLVAVTRSFAGSLDSRALLEELTSRLASALSLARASIVFVDEGGRTGTVVAASDGRSPPHNRIDLAKYPEIEEALRTRAAVVIADAGSHPLLDPVKEAISSIGLSSLAVLPLVCETGVVGVLFLRASASRREFTPHEIGFATAVANSTAVALRNARAAAALQRTNEFLERLIDSSVDAIVAADMRGRVMLFNRSAEVLFGQGAGQAIGRLRVTDLYPDGGAPEVMRMLRSEGFGGRDRLAAHRREIVGAGGERIPVQMTGAIIRDGARELATVGIFTDLRELVRTEERLVVTQEKLEKSERQAMIAELAGTAAHELNQPLTSVMGYAELIRRKLKPEDPLYRPIDVIVGEAERMAEIVRKIGKITRYETKQYVGRSRIVDLERATGEDGR